MAGPRDTIEFMADGQVIAALTAGPAADGAADGAGRQDKPLIVAAVTIDAPDRATRPRRMRNCAPLREAAERVLT